MSKGSEKPARVLVVEDEPETLRLEQTILEEAGLEVTKAQREGEAWNGCERSGMRSW